MYVELGIFAPLSPILFSFFSFFYFVLSYDHKADPAPSIHIFCTHMLRWYTSTYDFALVPGHIHFFPPSRPFQFDRSKRLKNAQGAYIFEHYTLLIYCLCHAVVAAAAAIFAYCANSNAPHT